LEHVLGRQNYEQLNPWLQYIAYSSRRDRDVTQFERVVQAATSNITAAYIGFRFSSGLRQLGGVGPAADKLGRLRLAKAMWGYLARPDHWHAIREDVFGRSAYMSDRAENFDRNIQVAVNEMLEYGLTGTRFNARLLLFRWSGEMDLFVTIPAWRAAYEKALTDFARPGIDAAELERKAVDYADSVIRTTQNAGSAKDLSMMQRRGPLMRLFTSFYTALGRLYNLTREEWGKGHGVKDFPRLAAHVLTVYTLPFVISSMVAGRLWGDEEDDDEGFFWWIGSGTLSEMMSPLVFVRDVFDYVSGARPVDFPLLGSTFRNAKKIVDAAGDAFDKDENVDIGELAEAVVEVAGTAMGLPSKQILASWRGSIRAMEEWNERSPAEKLFKTPWNLLMGPGKK
jgi:hypothetical protein